MDLFLARFVHLYVCLKYWEINISRIFCYFVILLLNKEEKMVNRKKWQLPRTGTYFLKIKYEILQRTLFDLTGL